MVIQNKPNGFVARGLLSLRRNNRDHHSCCRKEVAEVKRTNVEELVTLEGIVTPGDWDDRQRVTAYVLGTFNEEEYRLFFRSSREAKSFAGTSGKRWRSPEP